VVACWLQDIVLIAIIGHYSGVESWRMLGGSALFGLFCWWLTSMFCSTGTLRRESPEILQPQSAYDPVAMSLAPGQWEQHADCPCMNLPVAR